ncbi:MAG: hypothetical protein PVG90_02340 [Bacillota bacterium]
MRNWRFSRKYRDMRLHRDQDTFGALLANIWQAVPAQFIVTIPLFSS